MEDRRMGKVAEGEGTGAPGAGGGAPLATARWLRLLVAAMLVGGLLAGGFGRAQAAVAAPAAAQGDEDEEDEEETPEAEEEDDEDLRDPDEEDEEAAEDDEAEDEPADDGEADEDEDDEAPTGDEVTYESPLYGYTLTYDPQVWEEVNEDSDPDDEYDRLILSDGSGVIEFVGDPDYEDDQLDQCLEDYVAGLEQGENISDVEPLEDEDGEEIAGDDDGVAFAAHSYSLETDDGEALDLARHTECQAIGDGVTLVVLHVSLVDDYEDQSEARAELLEGFEAADGGTDGDEEADDEDEADEDEADEDEADEDEADEDEADEDEADEEETDGGEEDEEADASAVGFAGDWAGESEDGQDFSFVVDEEGVASVSLAYDCDGSPTFSGLAVFPSAPIEDDAFVFESGSDEVTTVTGAFTSDEEAEGTVEISGGDCDVAFDWTAERA